MQCRLLTMVDTMYSPKYDIIYEGNYTKWCKFANSLMLRLAMRIVYANPTLAQQYAEKAINNPYGVIDNMRMLLNFQRELVLH